MVERARELPRAPIAGIGRYRVGERLEEFPIGWDDTDRDTAWAVRRLTQWGLNRESYVMVTAAMWQGPWISPVLRAFREIGATFGIADVFGWDARRAATFARRLPLSMMLGIGAETAAALNGDGQLAALLGKVPALLAHPDAVGTLSGAGLRPGVMTFAGPALTLECPERAGAHVDGAEWSVGSAGGELVLSTAGPRAFQVSGEALGIAGTVETGTCGCGSTDPRIRLA